MSDSQGYLQQHTNPPVFLISLVLVVAFLVWAIAAILLVAGAFAASGNALSALQTASVTSGLPFSIVLALMCWGLVRQFRLDRVPPPKGVVVDATAGQEHS